MDAQQFLQDRLGTLMTMLAPIKPIAKPLLHIKGSAPVSEDEYNPGPLVKIDLDGIGA